ncbi:MAG TPA: IS200/IS605 family transposase [Flavobacteriales bacterium]
MPQSLAHVIIHLVFGTKNRRPVLVQPYRASVHAYLATLSRELQCECYRVGGVEDHVHMAIRLHRTVAIADLVEHVKARSSYWLKQQDPSFKDFSWQKGYAVFSAFYPDADRLIAYIDNQEEHHRKGSFEEEYRALLIESGLEFDERYMWD